MVVPVRCEYRSLCLSLSFISGRFLPLLDSPSRFHSAPAGVPLATPNKQYEHDPSFPAERTFHFSPCILSRFFFFREQGRRGVPGIP